LHAPCSADRAYAGQGRVTLVSTLTTRLNSTWFWRCQERCVEGLSALLQRVAESALEAQGARSSTRLSEVGRKTLLV
jgi:hypothetical protein